jgi:UDP-3-O-[3-hydroxymyristoyl] N-acetylglucosamine deacetylase
MFYQKTIKKRVRVEGVGLHTGKPASLEFCPAPPNSGIQFIRSDLPGRPRLQVLAHKVQATSMATTIGGEFFSVSTVEHCLSALSALRIDNLFIELLGPEIPIVDGSAIPYLSALVSVGFFEQDFPREYLYVTKSIEFTEGDKVARVTPYNGLRISCEIDFNHPSIGKQSFDLEINENTFTNEIASARTFGFLKDVEALQKRGLALGGSLQNAIVLDEEKILNEEGLRYSDEFVRHKVLDALGDLVTLGHPLMGHLQLEKTGHDLMNKFVKKILNSPECYNLVQLGTDPTETLNSQRFGM